jgi:hypothetical protein
MRNVSLKDENMRVKLTPEKEVRAIYYAFLVIKLNLTFECFHQYEMVMLKLILI